VVDERTEEEQIEAVKAWWKRNGTSLLVGIGLAVALVLGWNAWENYQVEQRMAAAARFQELSAALSTPSEEEDRQSASVTYVADQLRSEHGDSVYAVLGSLLEAGYLVEANDAAAATKSLQWALEHAGEAPLPLIIRERLARAQFTAGESEEALSTLEAAGDPGPFMPVYKELEGDIQKAQGDIEAARAAYKAASESTPAGSANPILQYKMADLAISGDA
jgi:predicted negative regulator of RcsB-dependent stress response